MKRMQIVLIAGLCSVFAGCAEQRSQGEKPTTAAPVPAAKLAATTTPRLRTDGDRPARHKKIVAEAAKGGHQIVFLGASIIEFWETTGKQSWNSVWLPRHSIDCGIGGDRTQDVLGRLDDGLLAALAGPNNDVRWIVINIGSNNLEIDSAADIAAGIGAILAKLQSELPEAKVVLSTVLPRGQWPNPLRQKASDTNELLGPMVAARFPGRVQMMDIGPKFLRANGEIPAELMPDFLHPSAAGYKIWSDELERVIR